MNQILRNVTAETFPRQSNIDLVLNLAPALPLVEADEAKLKRAFAELIENAIDFQPDGGRLTVRTSLLDKQAARVVTKTAWDGDVVQIEFEDRGPGLSEQDRERVFTPFFTRKAKGMGLGLSIVKGIVQAHGGAICEIGSQESGVGSTPDGAHGAHFLILLPVVKKIKSQDTGESANE
jgi:signal transduction histidine kinase